MEFEVSKSLKSGFFLDRDPLLDIWIQLKYERVTDFCFKGVFGLNLLLLKTEN